MAYTQTMVDDLTEKIAAAEISIRHGDKSVTLATLGEMQMLRDRMIRSLQGAAYRPSIHRAKFSREDRR